VKWGDGKWAKWALAGCAFAGGFVMARKSSIGATLTYEGLVLAMKALGVDPLVAKAVMKVESGGRSEAAEAAGRMTIRFEPHVFYRYAKVAILLPGMSNVSDGRSRRGGQDDEYDALAKALAIDARGAYESISMGLFQIMGFNFKVCGYSSAAEMFEALSTSVGSQYASFGRFMVGYAGGGLLQAMRAKDWPTFGKLYNGTASAGPIYERAYNAVRATVGRV
jgi:hypothetical protein